jgi:SAM-dependent methyltransferase
LTPEVLLLHQELDAHHWWFRARRRILLDLIAELLPKDKTTLVVDVGCGAGATTVAIDERYACIGVDASAEVIGAARARFPKTKFQVADSAAVAYELAKDARLILMADVLEHVADDREFLSEWVSAASPGGWFLITVPADPGLWSVHDKSHGHHRRYTRTMLTDLWRHLPVSLRFLSHFNSRLYPIVRAVRARRKTTALRSPSHDLRLPIGPINRALEAIFYGESGRLLTALRHGESGPYWRGVSLAAVIRKNE